MINKGNGLLLGDFKVFYGYVSHGINIIRKPSSLTGQRVAEDPAFKGFRQSGNRMKEASPIASLLYGLIPKDKKVYALYRTLTGEALRMIKQGMNKEEIILKLKEQYINPLVEHILSPLIPPEKNIRLAGKLRPEWKSCLFSRNLFTVHPISRNGRTRFPTMFPWPEELSESSVISRGMLT